MKIFNSIKWRLQIWYGLILVAVLVGFGVTAYQLQQGRQFRRTDDEIQRRFSILASAFRPPPRGRDLGERPLNRPPRDQFPSSQSPDDNLPEQNFLPPREFHLPPQAAGLFDANDPNGFYFIIKSNDGKEIARSDNAPTQAASDGFDSGPTTRVNTMPINPARPRPPQTIGNFREINHDLPSGETILVGCSIAPELKELRLAALKLSIIGGIILFFGLAVGWWISSRAIQPIETISATAVKISAGDLSQRINITDAETELGQLANVLNSTFARLDAAFAQQKQFASDAAHELRTPVTVILTQTQTALHREREARDYKETIEACQRAAQRMKKLISALLELARLDAGQEQMKRSQFDFSKTVGDCVDLIRPLADERSVKIFSELAPVEIAGDSERLAQVVTNLLTNALQYNRDGGEVHVKLNRENDFAVLTLSDTGIGIPAEVLSRVFERFFRADKSRSSGNAGLGLAISKAIVEAHSGTIEVASKEDAGTIFTIRLPLA